jgi:hypothetical protein
MKVMVFCIFAKYSQKLHFALVFLVGYMTLCQTKEKSAVSGSNRSLKNVQLCSMCYAREVCCRAVPCLAHMKQEPDPLPQGTRPPPLSAWPLET